MVCSAGIAPVPTTCPTLRPVGVSPGAHLIPTMYRSETGVLAAGNSSSVGVGSKNSLDMVTVALRIQLDEGAHHLKVSCSIRCHFVGAVS